MLRGKCITIFLLAMLLSFWGHGVAPAQDKYKIACFIRSMDDEYLEDLSEELKKALQKDFELEIYDARSDMNVQMEQIRKSLRSGTDLVLVNIVMPVYVSEILDLLKRHGVPSIFFKNEPNARVFEGYKNAVLVSNNGAEEGRRQGRLLDLVWNPEKYDKNKDGKLQYILLQGPVGNFEAISRSMYAVLTARELGLELEQLGENYVCNWLNDCSYKAMPEIMRSHGSKLELIISNNDNMALGALRYLNELGINVESDDIAIIGFDGIKEACEKIKKGVFTATVKQELDEMAELIKAMIDNYFSGKDWLYATGYQWEVDNVSVRINGRYSYYAKEGAYVRRLIDVTQ